MNSKPIRVQRKRTKGWRMPENTKCVDRSTKWGNPFKPTRLQDQAHVVNAFRLFYHYDVEFREAVKRELRGKNLACFCALNVPCHADVLIEWANE
jgi:hypothetical protein